MHSYCTWHHNINFSSLTTIHSLFPPYHFRGVGIWAKSRQCGSEVSYRSASLSRAPVWLIPSQIAVFQKKKKNRSSLFKEGLRGSLKSLNASCSYNFRSLSLAQNVLHRKTTNLISLTHDLFEVVSEEILIAIVT